MTDAELKDSEPKDDDPMRDLLKRLRTPSSASRLAAQLELPRQRLNYHLKALEKAGLVELVEERPRRGCVERMLKVTSRAFVVNPALLGALSENPEQARDQFSSAFLNGRFLGGGETPGLVICHVDLLAIYMIYYSTIDILDN